MPIPNLRHVPVSSLRDLTLTAMRELTDTLIVDEGDKPLAVIMPYKTFQSIQRAISPVSEEKGFGGFELRDMWPK